MSFILDAIKKSEDQRQRSKQPDVHSLQTELNHYRSKRNTVGRFVMFLLALIILGLVAWSFWPQLLKQLQSIEVNNPLKPAQQNSLAPTVANQSAANSSVLVSYYNADDTLPARHLIKELWQLPADYQAAIPEFEFSFHFYSTDSSKRSTVINGRTMREGQMLTGNIKLRVITSTGVILHNNGQFFHINVIEKW